MNRNQIKRIRRLSEMSQSEIIRQTPSIQKSSKDWKKVLGSEWVWFASIITGSWLLSYILSFLALPGDLVKLSKLPPLLSFLLILIYGIRLTVWSIRQMQEE